MILYQIFKDPFLSKSFVSFFRFQKRVFMNEKIHQPNDTNLRCLQT